MNSVTTPIDELERLADLVHRQHPSVNTQLLMPDDKYQTRTVTLDAVMREVTDCIAQEFRGRRAADFPTLYCAWGKCRVGSTALTNLFGVAGMPSYFQPVKVVLRHALMGRAGAPWDLPFAADHPVVFSKEMAGPYALAECLFQPLQPLIEAGYPADKLHFIMLDRDPASSLASWIEKWSDRVPDATLMQNFVISSLNTLRVETYARRQGVPVTHYVYEASKEPVPSIRALFTRLGLAHRFTEDAVTEWNEMGRLESKDARITFVKEPTVYTVPGLHGEDTAYRYRTRKTSGLSADRLDLLDRFGINGIYRTSVEACIRDLGFDAATAERLFGDVLGVDA
ncbi:sulfotransferase family protein [Rhodopseudomonas sp. P2A-2r]|uniref:sulfotransferase family protein n=1 Tax=unclassified Rhodopseudomonas TaxID=2638247 RepID=UPI002234E0EE|nr:sulfotransferase family protein [Rhodopseudomonas sp. P2A-2r]UZE51673.1 sulfotransferase family protein [Rhodopseudomonas sp. P2A-2r]